MDSNSGQVNSDPERLATSVTPEIKRKVRLLAAEEGRQMSEWVREAVLEKMEREGEDLDEGNQTKTAADD